jgi:hypothetical protein
MCAHRFNLACSGVTAGTVREEPVYNIANNRKLRERVEEEKERNEITW